MRNRRLITIRTTGRNLRRDVERATRKARPIPYAVTAKGWNAQIQKREQGR